LACGGFGWKLRRIRIPATSVNIMATARDNIDALTGLRFVAAFTIVLGHYYQPWLEVSGIGMPLFFTLSGFIIHYVYAGSFAGGWRPATREFAVARISRIYPLYLALLAYNLYRYTMGLSLAQSSNRVVSLAYLFGVWTWWPFTVDGHPLLDWQYHLSWSVSTELFFYLAYALFFYRISRIRNVGFCLGLIAVFCLASYLLFYGLFITRDLWEPRGLHYFPQFSTYANNFGESFYRWLLYFSPYARIFEFIGGCLTAQAFLLVRRNPALRSRICSGVLAWLAIAVMLSLWAAFFYNGMRNPWLTPGNTSLAAFLVSLHMNFLLAPPCYLLIFALALGGSAVGRALGARIPVVLGDISYSTYLSHLSADRVLVHLRIDFSAVLPHLIAIFAAVYALSWLLYWTIEVPPRRFLRRMLSRSAPPAAVPPEVLAKHTADG
jgi:peptidoglycan/LPS O-acetylase OafA/YrhL